jgi:wyosine [tRNA(Phe)-imidazoG37] synthetase (radical SAM superfamily)
MDRDQYRYIYGPVSSWRLGRSLGIDPLSGREKICNFDCLYCQLGETTNYAAKRKEYVPTDRIIEELRSMPVTDLDYITFSGTGEPTLAWNLGEMIREIRKIRKEKVAVITNSSLMENESVRKDLSLADLVEAKLDAPSRKLFQEINRPTEGISFSGMIGGLLRFAEIYRGKLAIQIMFIGENMGEAGRIAELVRRIGPDEVHLNTPLRESPAHPLPPSDLTAIGKCFFGLRQLSVYEAEKKTVNAISGEDTLRRRGKRR